jgi:hypothetical protein
MLISRAFTLTLSNPILEIQEPPKKEDAEYNFEEGIRYLLKIEIKKLKLENVKKFTVEEMEKKIHDTDRIHSLEVYKAEIKIMDALMGTDKKNKEVYKDKKKKLETYYNKMKSEFDSGEIKVQSILKNMKEVKEVVIDKIYPEFRGAVVTPPACEPTKVGGLSRRASQKIKQKKTMTQPPSLKVLENLPSGVNHIDIQDPDNAGNLICVSYLEKRIKVLNLQMATAINKGMKVPDAIKNKVKLMIRNKTILEGSINSEKLSPEQYKEILGKQLEKDKATLEYLVKCKQDKNAAIVRERIDCINNELSSFN